MSDITCPACGEAMRWKYLKAPRCMKCEEQLIEDLEGTCNSLDEVAENLGIDTARALEIVAESEIEQCACCNWWCGGDEIEVVEDEYTCLDCQEES